MDSKIECFSTLKDYSIESLTFGKLVNTHYFSSAANDYKRNKNQGKPVYCLAPYNSRENNDYWNEQIRRCLEGYKVGDLKISGRMYFYLNFFIMMRTPENTPKNVKVVTKIKDFPAFTMIQYLWWNFQIFAHVGGTFLGIESEGGKDICCLKCRGAGFSYMDASDSVYNFLFYRDSKSFEFAYSREYLDGSDGIMIKIKDALDFLSESTKSYLLNGKLTESSRFGLTRYNLGEEPKEFISGYKDLSGTTHGFNSAIISVICNVPDKARGKRGMKITMEEFGSFPNSLDVLKTSQALVKDSASFKTGQIKMFGTGGTAGKGIDGLEEVFYNPDAYDCLSFPNIFSEGDVHDKIGFFVPSYLVNYKLKDKDGNPLVKETLALEAIERGKKEKLTSDAFDKHVAEQPQTPEEALKRLFKNSFPTKEIAKRLLKLRTDGETLNRLIYCDLELSKDGKKVKIVSNENPPILIYPHNTEEYNDGCVIIKQLPVNLGTEENLKVPNIYFITLDNFSVDEVEDKTSLFCAYVWKTYNDYDNSFSRVPVAWYRGRPNKQSKAFFTLMKLSMMYGNAEIHGEYNAAGVICINWFINKGKGHLIASSDSSYTTDNKDKDTKWQKITAETKKTNIQLLAEYFLEERSYSTPIETYEDDVDLNFLLENDFDNIKSKEGSVINTNLDEIDDIVLLQETLVFKGQNADSISSASLAPRLLGDREIKYRKSKMINNLDEISYLDELCNF